MLASPPGQPPSRVNRQAANGPTLYSLDRQMNEMERRVSGLGQTVETELPRAAAEHEELRGALKRLGDTIRDPESGLIVQFADLRREQRRLRRDLIAILSGVVLVAQIAAPFVHDLLRATLRLP